MTITNQAELEQWLATAELPNTNIEAVLLATDPNRKTVTIRLQALKAEAPPTTPVPPPPPAFGAPSSGT